jgi:hypothetical protein
VVEMVAEAVQLLRVNPKEVLHNPVNPPKLTSRRS